MFRVLLFWMIWTLYSIPAKMAANPRHGWPLWFINQKHVLCDLWAGLCWMFTYQYLKQNVVLPVLTFQIAGVTLNWTQHTEVARNQLMRWRRRHINVSKVSLLKYQAHKVVLLPTFCFFLSVLSMLKCHQCQGSKYSFKGPIKARQIYKPSKARQLYAHHWFKWVLHPWPILWPLMHFAQKLQHIGDKQDMFLIGHIPRNLTTALEFHKLKWLLSYGSKHEKYWFSYICYYNFTTMDSTEVKLWFFEFLGTFLTRSIGYSVHSCFIFWENAQSLQK